MFDAFTAKVLRSLPPAFDYRAGECPVVDAVVNRLIRNEYSVFVHFWPESNLDAVPAIAARGALGRNQDGLVFRASDADSYHLTDGFPRRIAINLRDRVLERPEDYAGIDKVLCRHVELALDLRAQGIRAERFSYDTVVKTVVEFLPDLAETVEDNTFSVIIPTCDKPEHLRHTLSALRRQAYPGEFEILVVDSGASEEVRERNRQQCARYAARYERLPSGDGQDAARAKNRGLELATGQYLLVVEDDLLLPCWHLLTCQRLLQQWGDRTALFSPREDVSCAASAPVCRGERDLAAVPVPFGASEVHRQLPDSIHETAVGNLAFSRVVVEAGLRYEESLTHGWEDVEFHCRLRDAGYQIARLPSSRCLHLPHRREGFHAVQMLRHETKFLERHPHALLQGQLQLALEPADAGCVSIVVPVHARSVRPAERLLALLRQQIYAGELEILLCDDASPCSQELEALCHRSRARYLPVQRPPGLESLSHRARARNVGVAAARGQYVLFLDQDIVLLPHHIQNCVNILRYHGDNVVCQGARHNLSDLTLMDEITPYARFRLSAERLASLLGCSPQVARIPVAQFEDNWPTVWGHNLFMARNVLDRTGLFDEVYVGWGEEDLDLSYRMYRIGIRFAVLKDLPVYHVGHPREELGPSGGEQNRRNVIRFFRKFPEARTARPDIYRCVEDELAGLSA